MKSVVVGESLLRGLRTELGFWLLGAEIVTEGAEVLECVNSLCQGW